MKKTAVYFLLLGLLVGCQNVQKVPAPKNLIPEDTMVNILMDLAKIDAAMSYNKKEFYEQGINPFHYVYKKYDIDSLQLAQSSAYYIDRHEINHRIYETVKERLEKQTAVLDSIMEQKDSLKRKKLVPREVKNISTSNALHALKPQIDQTSKRTQE